MINSRFDAFTEYRQLPTLREMIPSRASRCRVKVDLLIVRAGVEGLKTAPDGMVSVMPTQIVGIESFESNGYHDVFERAVGRGVIALEHEQAVQAYVDSQE